ncbi:MAG: alpha-ribazole phosphatase [Ktedonobacteraceae bacterium]
MRLIVVRHGETLYNIQNRITGQSDVPLSPLGERQAELVGVYLANEKIDLIVSSDLQRARATAQAIARTHDLPIHDDADLREIAMGEWEGHNSEEITAHFADSQVRWRADATNYAIPGGGENLTQVHARIARAIERWQTQYPDATVVWATHGGFIGLLACHLLGLDISRRWQFRHDNASITEFWLQPERIIMARLNETAHLADIGLVEGAEA